MGNLMGFTIPIPPPKLPPDLERAIEASVVQFEQRFGGMAMLARANGWIEDYRREITAIARKAFEAGGGK